MKKHEGYNLIETSDIDAAINWAKGIRPEDPTDPAKVAEIALLRDVLVTGLTYARVVSENMGGLPSFRPGQTQKERQAAMMAAAKMARRPDGSQNRRKRGKK